MEVSVINVSGQAVKKIQLADDIFAVEMNEAVLHSVVKAYQANKRQGTHATKTRSFVSGGGKKPFRQKGTGQARQGSTRAPHYPGGGIAHGPQPRDYRQAVNKRVRQLALKIALSDRVRSGKLVVVDNFAVSKYSTKHVAKVITTLKLGKTLLSDERKDDLLFKSTRNLHGVSAVQSAELNAEHILRYDTVVLSENALHSLQERLKEKAHAST